MIDPRRRRPASDAPRHGRPVTASVRRRVPACVGRDANLATRLVPVPRVRARPLRSLSARRPRAPRYGVPWRRVPPFRRPRAARWSPRASRGRHDRR